MKLTKTHKIGIWGLGRVGSSALNFLHNFSLSAIDAKKINLNQQQDLYKKKIMTYDENAKIVSELELT